MAAPLVVTLVAHDIGPVGGMERQLSELALGLCRSGHDVSVIARTCELPEGSGVRIHRVWAPRRPFLLGYAWWMVMGSLAVRRHRRGLVQTAGAIVLNRVDVIAVHCCHQVYRPPAPGDAPAQRAYAAFVSLVKRTVERVCFTANTRARFVCVSNGVADEIRRYYPRTRSRVLTIHNGVDLETFSPGARAADSLALRERLALTQDRLLLAFVGGSWEHKGLPSLIRALAGADGWDVLVAGPGDPRRLSDLAEEMGVGERVHWLGVVRDMPPVYGAADAFALPSLYETFSLVTFEAAASGLPVLATPVSGVSELISDGRSGFVIDRDPALIAERLRRLESDPQLRASIGAAAMDFSWQRMIAAHEELYRQLRAGCPQTTAHSAALD
jgi:glycosyltransferase involved in cell wall biosynthesis